MSKRPYTGVQFYAVRTNPRCERRAAMGLRAEGFEVYLPTEVRFKRMAAKLVTRAKRHMRPVERVETPLLAGYLFVRVDYPRQSFATIRSAHGVHSLVGIQGDPTPIADAEIDFLRQVEAEVNSAHANPEPTYKPDELLKVRSGMWQGHVGRFMAETVEGRIRMVLEGSHIHGAQEFKSEQVERAA